MARNTHIVTLMIITLLGPSCAKQKADRPDYWEEEEIRQQKWHHEYFSEINPASKLRLTISTESNEYYQGESIDLILSLKNISTDYINIIHEDISPAYGTTSTALIDSKDYYIPLYGGCITLNYGIRPDFCGYTLAPGDSVVELINTMYLTKKGKSLTVEWGIGYINYTDPGLYT